MLQSIHCVLLLLLPLAAAQDLVKFPAPDYNCPEKNGKFPDPAQCDKFFLCKNATAEEVFCPEGLFFDFSIPNREKCVLPHNVECGNRLLIQERTEGIDERCPKANGYFNHQDPSVCDKYMNCDHGRYHEFPCAPTLFFDETTGGCVLENSLSEGARRCNKDQEFQEIDGFTCPGGEVIGPQSLLQEHPIYPHPTDCRFYFTCFFGKVTLKSTVVYIKLE